MRASITINTVQGIGDIFWCYQKLAPHFETININVLCLALVTLQLRAKSFCSMLPKVGTTNFIVATPEHYRRVASSRYALADLMRATKTDYACNAPLEQGIALRDIDPGYDVAESVDLGLTAYATQEDYVCAFVSGTRNPTCWNDVKWVEFIAAVASKLGTRRVVLIGAEWDRTMQDQVAQGLRRHGLRSANYTGLLELGDSVNIIRRSRLFVGFQSGLGVIADNYDVPQVMLYYKSLAAMAYTWCKPANARTLFQAATFDETPATVAARIGVESTTSYQQEARCILPAAN